jgi:hypothetical protein
MNRNSKYYIYNIFSVQGLILKITLLRTPIQCRIIQIKVAL